jgi:hypothetical protein
LLLDKTHGEEHSFYEKLVQLLTERCLTTILKKKPLDLKQLTENSVFMLISPQKDWEKDEIETVRRYVENHGGIMVLMVYNGPNREHLNRLLEPFGLAVTEDKVNDKNLDRENLGDSPLLDGVDSLASGKVWMHGSTGVAALDQAEVLLTYKDVMMGAKKSLGKGAVHVFSCLPVLGNKQLKQDGNARFFDNLLESLETLPITATVEAAAKEEAESTEKILGYMEFDSSMLLFFTPLRIIVVNIKGASAPLKLLGFGAGGIIGLGVVDEMVKQPQKQIVSELSKLREVKPDTILRAFEGSFGITYDDIESLELCISQSSWGFQGIRVKTASKKYEFNYVTGDFGFEFDHLNKLLRPFLADKISFRG